MARKKRTRKKKAKEEKPKIEEPEKKVEEPKVEETKATKDTAEVVKEVKLTREQIIIQACQHFGVARSDVATVEDVDDGIVIELKPPTAKKLKYSIDKK